MYDLLRSISVLFLLTLLTGAVYPGLVTASAQLFSEKANGSVLYDNRPVGSELIGQRFSAAKYFHGRPSASDFATIPSGASNAAMTNRSWVETVSQRSRVLQEENPGVPVPSDLLTASASGLDPHISPESARFQVPRIAKARNLSPDQRQKLDELVNHAIEEPQLGILGQARVNVLKINLELDKNL